MFYTRKVYLELKEHATKKQYNLLSFILLSQL